MENIPTQSFYKKGDLFAATAYDPGDGRTTDAFTSHGGSFVPAHVFKNGRWVRSLQLTTYCKIGGSYGAENWLTIEEIRSRIPPLKLKYIDIGAKLYNMLPCSNCADTSVKFYVYKPKSPCARDVAKALRGDKAALDQIRDSECSGQTFQQTYPEWVDPEGPPPFDSSDASPQGSGQQTATAESLSAVSFLKSVYEPYFHDHLSFLGDARSDPRTVDETLEPSLAVLWHRYSSSPKRHDSPGPIDGDPICSCQEADIRNLHFTVMDTGKGTFTGVATFKLGHDTRVISFSLVLLNQQWRISDVSDNENGASLRKVLEMDNNNSG